MQVLERTRADGRQLRLADVPLILMYHAVAAVGSDPNRLCVTPGRFARQLSWLRRRGLRGVGIGELADAMRAGEHRGLVGITFDDGYASILESAVCELARHDFGATVFVISGRLGGTNEWDEGPRWQLMSASQVTGLAAAGIEIGSHSGTHVPLAGLPPGQLAAEVAGSRSALTEVLGRQVRGFAYPYGSMDSAARTAVLAAGYDYACAVRAPVSAIGLAALPRSYVGQRDGAMRMAAKHLLYKGDIAVRGRRQ